MKNILTTLLLSLCFFYINVARADDIYYCPKTAQYIQIGMNESQVEQLCGQPTRKSEKTKYVTENKSQQNIDSTNYSLNTNIYIPTRNTHTQKGTVQEYQQKMKDQQACIRSSNYLLKKGYSARQINNMCEEKIFPERSVTQIKTKQTATTTKKRISTWVYVQSSYVPNTVLTFINGQLTQIQTQ